MKRNFTQEIPFLALIVLALTYFSVPKIELNQETVATKVWSTKKTKVKSGEEAFMKPDGFIDYYNSISKEIDKSESG